MPAETHTTSEPVSAEEVLALGERPTRKMVVEATMYPRVSKHGYGIGTDLDTMRRSTSRAIQMAIQMTVGGIG